MQQMVKNDMRFLVVDVCGKIIRMKIGKVAKVEDEIQVNESFIFLLSPLVQCKEWNQPMELQTPCISWFDVCDFYIVLNDRDNIFDCNLVSAITNKKKHYYGGNEWYSVFGYDGDRESFEQINITSLRTIKSFMYLCESYTLKNNLKIEKRSGVSKLEVDWAVYLPDVIQPNKQQLGVVSNFNNSINLISTTDNMIEVKGENTVLEEMGRDKINFDKQLDTKSRILLYCSECKKNVVVEYVKHDYNGSHFICTEMRSAFKICGHFCSKYHI